MNESPSNTDLFSDCDHYRHHHCLLYSAPPLPQVHFFNPKTREPSLFLSQDFDLNFFKDDRLPESCLDSRPALHVQRGHHVCHSSSNVRWKSVDNSFLNIFVIHPQISSFNRLPCRSQLCVRTQTQSHNNFPRADVQVSTLQSLQKSRFYKNHVS